MLEHPADRNERCELAGVLLLGERRFLQIVEGSEADLRELFQRVIREGVHHPLLLIDFEPIAERALPAAGMRLINLNALDTQSVADLLQDVLGESEFHPEQFSSEQAVRVAVEFVQQLGSGFPAAYDDISDALLAY